jgi:hypothetical protein
MIRSRQPRPATSHSPRTLPLSPFSHTSLPTLCLSPLPTSPNSTHPTQLDTPVPPQPPCYQSNAHAFRHTWGCPSVSTSNFELSTPDRSFRKSSHPRLHQCHSTPLSRPLFSYSYALFSTKQNAISRLFFSLRTLCAKPIGWGDPSGRDSTYCLSSNVQSFQFSIVPTPCLPLCILRLAFTPQCALLLGAP